MAPDYEKLIATGSKGIIVEAEKFQAEMKAAGLKSELHLYEDQPHGFFNESKGGTEIFLDTVPQGPVSTVHLRIKEALLSFDTTFDNCVSKYNLPG